MLLKKQVAGKKRSSFCISYTCDLLYKSVTTSMKLDDLQGRYTVTDTFAKSVRFLLQATALADQKGHFTNKLM